MKRSIPLVDLKRQYQDLKVQLDRAVAKILFQGNFILGGEVDRFEQAFAKYCGTKYCVGVASGADALHLSLRALGIGIGDEIITVPNTFIATVFAIVLVGAKPVLVDINPDTYQIDTIELEKAITSKTKAIIPVHLYGIPSPMKEIMRIARKYGLYVLEDACQAHGSLIYGKKCGSFGHIAAFSFYPGKNLGAAGDGGAVVTDNKTLADKIRVMRDVGQTRKYRHDVLGFNSRLDTLQAAVLSVKLKQLEWWNSNRRKLAKLYGNLLGSLPLILPPGWDKWKLSNYHLYVIRTKRRDSLRAFLAEHGVFCGIHYPIPIHLQKSMKILGYKKKDFPVTEQYAKEILSLPMFPELTGKEVKYICSLIRKFFLNKNKNAKT